MACCTTGDYCIGILWSWRRAKQELLVAEEGVVLLLSLLCDYQLITMVVAKGGKEIAAHVFKSCLI